MRRIARHLHSTLLMLLMAAFVGVPVGDALTCVMETPHAAVEQVASDAGKGGEGDVKHTGACNHNHCHHYSPCLPTGRPAALHVPLLAGWPTASDVALHAVALDELARPPRQ